MRPARTADSSAVLVQPNVIIRMKSILSLSLHDLLLESFFFNCMCMHSQGMFEHTKAMRIT